MKEQIFARVARMNPIVVLVAILIGSIVFVAVKKYAPDGGDEIAGWIFAAVTLFLRSDKGEKKADADAAEHVDGIGALDPAGGTGSIEKVPRASDVLAVKREILMAWAKAGREIDALAELKSETQALEVLTRCARSCPIDVPDEPTE